MPNALTRDPPDQFEDPFQGGDERAKYEALAGESHNAAIPEIAARRYCAIRFQSAGVFWAES